MRAVISDDELDEKVLNELEPNKYSYRTAKGIANSLHVEVKRVIPTLDRLKRFNKVRVSVIKKMMEKRYTPENLL